MPMSNKKIVVVGGGTGNHTTLTGLRSRECDVTAIVAMTDSGGSSGRLRDEMGHLPPGDLRRCLMALASDSAESNLMRRLFDFRFSTGDGLNGHSFGNLLLAALTEVTGDTITAIDEAARILGISGAVLPVTLTRSTLRARLVDGSELIGESAIDLRNDNLDVAIDYIYLDPKAYVYPPVLDAIAEADAIILGPGDIYTSVLPNLLVEDVAQAINEFRCHQGARVQPDDQAQRERRIPHIRFPGSPHGIPGHEPTVGFSCWSTALRCRRGCWSATQRKASTRVAVDESASLTMVGRIIDRPAAGPRSVHSPQPNRAGGRDHGPRRLCGSGHGAIQPQLRWCLTVTTSATCWRLKKP